MTMQKIPWSLDPAIRRRFEKRIYIGLPDLHARSKMVQIHLGGTPNEISQQNMAELGQRMEYYSGSGIP